jgi:hypothetical protein
VGYNSGDLRNSYAAIENLTMSGAQWVGGFVGYNTSNIANTFVAIDSYAGSSIERFGEGGSLPQYVFTNNYYNSGLTGDAWYEYNDDPSDTASEINTIDASELLLVLNSGSSAFRQVSSPSSEEFFPVLVESGVITLANQPRTLIYWSLEEEPAPEPEPTVTPPPSQPSPGFNDPSRGETYTYDPVFLTLELSILESEVGEPFVFDYRGFSTFGPIIKDYTSDVVITGSVNENVVGTYPVTLSLSAEGLTITRTFMIQIVDTTPPVISGPANVRLFVGEAYEGQITASDNVEEPVTLTLLSTLDTSTAGITEVTWQATDASGNVSTLTQTVNVVVPEVQVQTVSVNNQTFIFTASEADYDLTQLRVEYVVSRTEPTSSSNWQVFTGTPSANPGERVFVRLSDGINTSDVRQTIAVPETVTIVEPVVLPDVEPRSSNTFLIGLGSVAGLGAAATGWWFLLGKKRRQKEEAN